MCSDDRDPRPRRGVRRTGWFIDVPLLLLASALGSVLVFLAVLPRVVMGPGTTWAFVLENSVFYAIVGTLVWLCGCLPFGVHAAIAVFRSARLNRAQLGVVAAVQALTAGVTPLIVGYASGFIPMLGPFIGVGFAMALPIVLGLAIAAPVWATGEEPVRSRRRDEANGSAPGATA